MWQQSFPPGIQKCILGVYMNSLRDVGIRSEITWRETSIEVWREIFDLFVKTAFYVSKGTNLSRKKTTFESSDFFSNSSVFWATIYRACRKSFRQGYQNWKMQSSSHRINQKINFLKVLIFFQTLQNFERPFTVLGEKFSAGMSIKTIFWKFRKFSIISDLEHKIFVFVATEFTPGLSKLYSTCLYEFPLRRWY